MNKQKPKLLDQLSEKLPYFTDFFNESRAGYPVGNVLFPTVKDHLQSRWWFPSQKAFKGIAFELIFLELLSTTSKRGGFLLAVKVNALYPQEPEEPAREYNRWDEKSIKKNHRCRAKIN